MRWWKKRYGQEHRSRSSLANMASMPTRCSIGGNSTAKDDSTWRRRQRNWCLCGITEIVSDDRPPGKLCAGVIVVEVGRARIRVEGSVDAEALRLILERVGR